MSKGGIKFANLAINNGSVIVYYHRETTMRLPTGVNINKKRIQKVSTLTGTTSDKPYRPM
jgi:hypothetical protein